MVEGNVVHIGIHPYSPKPVTHDRLGQTYWYEDQPRFVQKRNDLLSEPGNNQILFIDHTVFDETTRLFSFDKTWEDRIVITEEASPLPKDMSFDEVSKELIGRFPNSRFVLWGTELHFSGRVITGGCVLGAFSNLVLPDKTLDLEACYLIPVPARVILKEIREGLLTVAEGFKMLTEQPDPYLQHLLDTRYDQVAGSG